MINRKRVEVRQALAENQFSALKLYHSDKKIHKSRVPKRFRKGETFKKILNELSHTFERVFLIEQRLRVPH